MHIIDWLAMLPTFITVGGSTVAAVVKLAKLVDAVERLTTSMENIVGKVDDHETRIHDLEKSATP
jgi:hypothetical protein